MQSCAQIPGNFNAIWSLQLIAGANKACPGPCPPRLLYRMKTSEERLSAPDSIHSDQAPALVPQASPVDKNTDSELLPLPCSGDEQCQIATDSVADSVVCPEPQQGDSVPLSSAPSEVEFSTPDELSPRIEEQELSENVSHPVEETNQPALESGEAVEGVSEEPGPVDEGDM